MSRLTPHARSLVFFAITCIFASFAYGHFAGTNIFGCHTPGGQGSGNPCHCHDPSDWDVELACQDGRPVDENNEGGEGDGDGDGDGEGDPDNSGENPEEVEEEPTSWRGLKIAEEETCTDYDSDFYPYGSNSDWGIAASMGGLWGPYEEVCFETVYDVTVEHMVARKEAHDSGMCDDDPAIKAQFASDFLNLTLASSSVNSEKSAKDVAEWLPVNNQCWYVWRVIKVKQKYDLTIDIAERDAMEEVLDECSVNDLFFEVPKACQDSWVEYLTNPPQN